LIDINSNLFKIFIKIHIRIKKYINDKINNFSLYYEKYIDWYNELYLGSTSSIPSLDEEIVNFDEFFNNIIQKLGI
jgi:hypothetical protein